MRIGDVIEGCLSLPPLHWLSYAGRALATDKIWRMKEREPILSFRPLTIFPCGKAVVIFTLYIDSSLNLL